MKITILFSFFLIAIPGGIKAQSSIFKSAQLVYDVDSSSKARILNGLDSLFFQVKNGGIDECLITKNNAPLSIAVFKSLAGMEDNKRDSINDFYKKQLINFYPVSHNEYWITIAFVGSKNNQPPVLKSIINLIALDSNNTITFALPTSYLTTNWKTKKIGNITYVFKDKLNVERATKFYIKNTTIAAKLGLKPEKLTFYLCKNYQEILQLLGYGYELESNGKTRNGYGVEAGNIFSVMNNEDFSHDLFHYYSEKIRGDAKPNWSAEEGLAYTWGNAYWTRANGETVEQKELVQALQEFIKSNPDADLLELFNSNAKVLKSLPKEVSVKSTIASLICDEIELEKGTEGIKTLLTCGSGDDNFFKTVDQLIGINKTNFNKEVMKLIIQYSK